MFDNILIVFLLLFACTLLLWQISNLVAIFYGCLFVKSNKENVKKILHNFAKKDLIFYELGCGNGDILLLADNLKMKVIGFEIAPFYYILSKLRTSFRKNIKVKYSNILKIDLSRADIIYCYLLPPLLKKLSIKFKKELSAQGRSASGGKINTIIISAGFPIDNLHLVQEYKINSRKFFVYKNV